MLGIMVFAMICPGVKCKVYAIGAGGGDRASEPCAASAMQNPRNAYRPPRVDGIWEIWGPDYNIPKATFYLLKGDYNPKP